MKSAWWNLLIIVFGVVVLLASLIMAEISLRQLYTSYDLASAYSYQVALPSVISASGIIIFLAFITIGLSAVSVGAYENVTKLLSGDDNDLILVAISGGVTLTLCFVALPLVLSRLDSIIF